jgi:hypothetical protein
MRSERRRAGARGTLLAIAALNGACGILGQRPEIADFIRQAQGEAGCLNPAGDLLTRYLDGSISPEEWSAPFECAESQLEQFERFVRPSTDAGYTSDDLHALVTGILVTDKPVSRELVAALFRLKASVIGGSPTYLSMRDVRRTRELLREARATSLALLPALAARARRPEGDELLAFTDAVRVATARIVAALGPTGSAEGTVPIGRADLELIGREFGPLIGRELPDTLASMVLAGKRVLQGGEPESVEPGAWLPMLRIAGELAGVYGAALALPAAPDDTSRVPELLAELARRTERTLAPTFLPYADGGIPNVSLVALIESLPDDWLPLRKATARDLLRLLTDRVFPTGPAGRFSAATLRAAIGELERWSEGRRHLNALYEEGARLAPDGESRARVLSALADRAVAVTDAERADVDRLARLVRDYEPLYDAGDDRLTLRPAMPFTRTHLETIHWVELAADLILRRWVTRPAGATGPVLARPSDFEKLLAELRNVVLDLKVMDPDVPLLHERRFREADLFTQASNGDGFVDLSEMTYLVAFLTSIGAQADELRADIALRCANQTGEDVLGWAWMDVDCFRNEHFGNLERWWLRLPLMLDHYRGLRGSARSEFEKNLEAGARLRGVSQEAVGAYDTQTFIGVAHYVENLFHRFDANRDQTLDVPELLRAFPVFRRTIAEVGKIDYKQKAILEAIFTYLVKHGRPPATNVGGYLDLGTWILSRPLWRIHATRADVIRIVSFFNKYE